MIRGWLLSLTLAIVGSLVVSPGILLAQQDKKDEKKEDKTLPKEKDEILGKSMGEWIKILRTHENPKLRQAALLALEFGNAASRTGLPAVIDATDKEKEKSAEVRRVAVTLLGRLGPATKGGLKALGGALQTDDDPAVREAAATVLGTDKFKESAQEYVPLLADALKDRHPGTRIAAATALRNVGEHAKPALPMLIEAARNPNEQALVRSAALHIISRYGKQNAQSVPLLVEILTNDKNPVAVREMAAEGLGRSGSDSADVIGALSKTVSDDNLELRKASAVSLSTLGLKAKSSWPVIQTRLMDKTAREPNNSIRNHLIRLTGVLAKEKSEAIAVLTKLAAEEDSRENRIAAIQELGELGPLAKGSLEVLSNLAQQDASAAVREAAAKAMKQVRGL